MATDIIARGMAASGVRLGSDGKIPAEYLPSYVDDIIDLLTISDTAPATCAEGDKYYNSTSKLIFTATGTNTWGTTGETPASGVIYINTAEDPSGSYRWDGNDLVLIGAAGGSGGKMYDFGDIISNSTITSGATFDMCKEILSDIFNNRDFNAKCRPSIYTSGGTAERYTFGFSFSEYAYQNKQNLYFYRIDNLGGENESYSTIHNYPGYAMYVISLNYDPTTNELVSVQFPYHPVNSRRFLPIANGVEYNPTGNYNPATVKFTRDTATDIANKKTVLLNYDGGEHNKIYFNDDNLLGTSLPETAVESPLHGPNYTMEYTYTSAQSITPASKFLAHIVKILKTTYIAAQTLNLTASIVRDNETLITKTVTSDQIPQTSGTADTTTVNVDIPFDFGLEEPLQLQVGDIFRVVLRNNAINYTSVAAGAIYSSSTNPTYIEQYSGGMSANYLYDTINGVTYTQHEINAMGSGGGVEGTHSVYTWDGEAVSSSDTEKIAMFQSFVDEVIADKKPILLISKYASIGNSDEKHFPIINYRWRPSLHRIDMNGFYTNNISQAQNNAIRAYTFLIYINCNNDNQVTSVGSIPSFGSYEHLFPASWCDYASSANGYNMASQYYLAPYNFKQYDVNTDWQPAHKKYVDDKIIWNVGGLLNYDGGEHSKIYFNAVNVLGTSAPENPVESPYNGPAYTMDYTYTSAQSITPSTKYLLHLVKILKATYITSQNLTATISIIRNGTTLASKTSSSVNIPYTTGTSGETTVSAEIVTNLGIEQNLEIQSGDIFRVVIASSQSGNSSSNGAIYSSDSEPTYIEQYSGGMDANNVYDTINGVTYSQHEINVQAGGNSDIPEIEIDYKGLNDTTLTYTNFKTTYPNTESSKWYKVKIINTPEGQTPVTRIVMSTYNANKVELKDGDKIFLYFSSDTLIYIVVEKFNVNEGNVIFRVNSGLLEMTYDYYLTSSITPIPLYYSNQFGGNQPRVITTNNTTAYTPTAGSYNPATAKYCEDYVNPTVTTSSDTTYTIASLIGNQSYKLGELTSLTITAVTTFDRESIIYFSSGTTPTDISIPDTIVNLGDAPTMTASGGVNTGTCETSKSYIIAILNNIAVWKAY